MRYILLFSCLSLIGCQTPLKPVEIKDGLPPERELLDARIKAAMSVEQAIDAQLELDEAKKNHAIEIASKQNELNIVTATANAEIIEKAKDAAQVRIIGYGLAGLGVAAIVGAAFLTWKGKFHSAGIAAAGGAGLILFSTVLADAASIIKWTLTALSGILVLSVAVWQLRNLYGWWRTEKQRRGKEDEAARLEDAGKPVAAAVARVEADILKHVDTLAYDPRHVTPNEREVKVLEAMP